MARTKQTARRSTGGTAPRRQLATLSSRTVTSSDNPFAGDPQITIFKEAGTRSIVVEGTAELNEVPDIVHLSFLITETGETLEDGIKKVLQKIAQVRTIATTECNVPNTHIYSDSIGSKAKKTEIGYYVSSKKKTTNNNEYDDDSEEETNVYRVHETKVHYEVRSVVRITLEGTDMVAGNFSKLCYKVMSKANLRTFDAPVLELSEITNLRNVTRTEACENAKEKAKAIVDALGDKKIQLGSPISLTDLFVSLSDDADDSFLGNWLSPEYNREIIPPPGDTTNVTHNKDALDEEPSAKRAKTTESVADGESKTDKEDNDPALDDSVMEQIFSVPSIKIAARIQAIFEITTPTNTKGKASK